jgi:hypothetical protein
MIEQWLQIEDSKYFISTFGNVSLDKKRIRKSKRNDKRKERIQIEVAGKIKNFSVSRLLLKTAGFKIEKKEIHHLDLNPFNNNIFNLVYVTSAEHRKYHNTKGLKKRFLTKGEKKIIKTSKLSIIKLSEKLKIPQQTIRYHKNEKIRNSKSLQNFSTYTKKLA